MSRNRLPRVPKFPIAGEKSPLTVIGGTLVIPATEKVNHPLIGKRAPEFELPDHLGRRCSLDAVISLGRPIILFFFPLAGSPHCTKESCLFRDALGITPVFSEMQAIVIGISQDPPERSRRFADEHNLGYRILHDETRSVMNEYGIGSILMGLIDQRYTFIIDPSGTVRAAVSGVFDAATHVRFAEKWLIRLEHELSERARQVMAYQSNAGDLISEGAGEATLRVMYGDDRGTSLGGIDAAPRYGAAPVPISAAAFDRIPKEKNRWRLWKTLFAHVTPHASDGSSDTVSAIDKPESGLRARARRFGLPSSKSSTRLNQLAKEQGERGEAHAEAMRRNSNRDLPPLPADAAREVAHHNHALNKGSLGSDRGSAGWTESSLSSHASTAATSAGSHARSGSRNDGQPTSQMVTSEVLMAADALPPRQGAGPSGLPAFGPPSRKASLNGRFEDVAPDELSDARLNHVKRSIPASSSAPLTSLHESGKLNQDKIRDGVLTPESMSKHSGGQPSRVLAARQRQPSSDGDHLARPRSARQPPAVVSNGRKSPGEMRLSPATNPLTIAADEATPRSQTATPLGRLREDDGQLQSNDTEPSSSQSNRLNRHRNASITDGVYRIGNMSLEYSQPRNAAASHDNADTANASSAFEYYKSLSPRTRASRQLSGGGTRDRPSSGSIKALADGNLPGAETSERPLSPRQSSQRLSASRQGVDAKVPMSGISSSTSTPLLSANSVDLHASRTPRGEATLLAPQRRISSSKVPTASADGHAADTGRYQITRDQQTTSSKNILHAAPLSPVTSRRSSGVAPSEEAVDTRRPSYAGSVCSMGTFGGKRGSEVYDISETEDDADDNN